MQLSLYERPAFEIGVALALIQAALDNPNVANESLPRAQGYLREAQRLTAGLTNYPFHREVKS